MFTELEINGKVYKLRLRTIDVIQLEKKIDHNIMDMFMALQNDKLPQLRELLGVLQVSLNAYHHGMKERDVYGIYDEYLADGHTMFDLIPVVIELMQNSGIIPKDAVEEVEEEKEEE